MLKRVLRSRRGEGYIDVCVLVICAMLVIALAIIVVINMVSDGKGRKQDRW